MHLLLVATMFEGKVPLKIRIADTGKLWGGFCLDHPAFLKECREWLGPENVVVQEEGKERMSVRVRPAGRTLFAFGHRVE